MMLVLTLILVLSLSLFAQSEGDYRTRDSGDWGNAQIWQRFNGASWVAIGTPPTGAETITVQDEDSVFVDTAVSITGTLVNQGIVIANTNLVIADGGTYQHDRDGGRMPIAVWEQGSTLLMTGVTTTAPDNRDQDYHHILFDTPGLLSNLNMNLNNNTIGGDIRVVNTGWARWYLTSALALDTAVVTIRGDVIVEDGAFSVQGTSNAQSTFIVHHHGHVTVTGGNFSISRGSQPGGTTTWYLYEGDFSMSDATTQSSTATPGGARFVFMKDGTQSLTLGEGNTLTALPIEVAAGTTLDMGDSRLAGSGVCVLNEGATLMTSLPEGVAGIFAEVVAEVTLEDGAGFGFNGATAQVTSDRMPATVGDLIIDNPAGVTLSLETHILGVLRLIAGEFDNTIPFTLGPEGRISYEGGSLKVTSVEASGPAIPGSFFVAQNYPNPFNPSTVIRFGLPAAAHVRVTVFNLLGREVVTLFEGPKEAGVHELLFDAANLGTDVYLCRIRAGDVTRTMRMVLMK